MTLRLCSFCGAAPGEHSGHRAAICSDCVRRLAGKAGWTVLPAGPQAASAREALERVLGDYPEADLEAFSLVGGVAPSRRGGAGGLRAGCSGGGAGGVRAGCSGLLSGAPD